MRRLRVLRTLGFRALPDSARMRGLFSRPVGGGYAEDVFQDDRDARLHRPGRLRLRF